MSVKHHKFTLLGLVAVAVLGAPTVTIAKESANRYVVVQWDLENAMRREALDAARYALFAQQAQARGNPDLAAVFMRVAQREETAHFKRFAALAGREVTMDPAVRQAELAKHQNTTDEANLRTAMSNERHQANMMRSELVNRALKYGDIEAAQTFLNVGEGDIDNLLEFRAAKKLLKRSGQQSAAVGS